MSYHIRVSGRGIVVNDNKIILNEFGKGEYFNIPGGAVEPGETVKDAVVREIFEETGLDVTVGELIYTYEYEPNKCDFMYGKVPHISFVFRCYLNGDDNIKPPTIPDVNPDNPNLIGVPKWIPINTLKDINYIPYIHKQLMEYFETNKFSPVFIEEPIIKEKQYCLRRKYERMSYARRNLSELTELLLKRTILFNYKFGFTGEMYIASDKFEDDYNEYKEILEKYFSLKEPFYCNRNRVYYSTDLIETMDLIPRIISDAYVILNSDISINNKEYIIFSLTEYMLSSIGKIIGVCFAHNALKNKYYIELKSYLSQMTDYLVCILFNEDFKTFPSISGDLIESILCDMQQLDIHDVREYSEMDNILILFITYFVYSDYLKTQDIIISPLQGGVLIPPFYISMEKYANSKIGKDTSINYEYVRLSNYDNSHYCESSLPEQIQVLKNQYNKNINVILLDDNTGTGRTIKAIKQEISKVFTNITTGVLECRWHTKLYKSEYPDYPAFQLNDVDLITPLCYRHYKVFDEQIEYIKNDKKLHNRYRDGKFYKLNMIYDEIDYYAYINENCVDNTIKKTLLNIYEKFKHIEEII